MPVFLGLDCGGSSTRTLALDERDARLFVGQAGTANLSSTPSDHLRRNLRQAIAGCPQPDFVCGCFAGLLDANDRERAERLLSELFPSAKVRAEPDFAATLSACESVDICVIAGTGSLVCSLHQGTYVKSGGRGYLLGDAGSAYRFGRDGLNAFLDAPETMSQGMIGVIEHQFATLEPTRVVSKLYKSSTPAALLARLAKPLGDDAKAGASYALASVEENLRELAGVVKGHVRMYFQGVGSVRMTLAGGLWKSSGIFKQSFTLQVTRALADLEVQIETIKRPPVEGAVLLAKEIRIGN